jgi:SAM-dependent methyltransferase
LLRELWGFLRDFTPERRRQRYGDADYDWDFRVDTTSATVGWRDRLLGVLTSPYQPTEPGLFREMMQALAAAMGDKGFSNFTFLDLGCGKGRTLLMACEYSFQRVVGVELLPDLCRVAEENVRRLSPSKCKVEVVCADARSFQFPPEPTVLYLFNPLPQSGLETLMRNLEVSLRQALREFYVLYHNPLLESAVAGCSPLRKLATTHQYVVYGSK